MPKNKVRNAFYFYMVDFREEQKLKGVFYQSMQEVAVAAGPSYKEAPESIKKKYNEMAIEDRVRVRGTTSKITSSGVPIDVIERQEQLKIEKEKYEKNDIKTMVKKQIQCDNILKEDFYIMDVHWYCSVLNHNYIMAEFGLVRVNLKDGITDFYHELINPGKAPRGYDSDCKLTCRELGLDMPDEELPISDYSIIFDTIKAFLLNGKKSGTYPPIYAIPDNIEPITNFVKQMCTVTGTDESLFRVYKLNTLLYNLDDKIKPEYDKVFSDERHAFHQLMRDTQKCVPSLGCDTHEERDKSLQCALSRCRRSAYSLLEHCCPADIQLSPGSHVPVEPKNAFIDCTREIRQDKRVCEMGEMDKVTYTVKKRDETKPAHDNGTSWSMKAVLEKSLNPLPALQSTSKGSSDSVISASSFATNLSGTERGLAILRQLKEIKIRKENERLNKNLLALSGTY